jgi:hypothetical protein
MTNCPASPLFGLTYAVAGRIGAVTSACTVLNGPFTREGMIAGLLDYFHKSHEECAATAMASVISPDRVCQRRGPSSGAA